MIQRKIRICRYYIKLKKTILGPQEYSENVMNITYIQILSVTPGSSLHS